MLGEQQASRDTFKSFSEMKSFSFFKKQTNTGDNRLFASTKTFPHKSELCQPINVM
jgi:hypothetical protein